MIYRLFRFMILFFCMQAQMVIAAPIVERVDQETPNYVIHIEYPQAFSSQAINKVIQSFIQEQRNEFLKSVDKTDELENNLPGQHGLHIVYRISYEQNQALSLLFHLSTYYKRAAHPMNRVTTFNFVNEKEIYLEELFTSNSQYLSMLAQICREQLQEKVEDKEWMMRGTQPEKQNYEAWYFTKNGLAIVFDTYQVAPYVMGPQTVKISKSQLIKWLKPEIVKAVWGL